MRSQITILLLLAAGLSVFLYTRPQVVVKSTQGANRDAAAAPTAEATSTENHSSSLTKEQKNEVAALQRRLAEAGNSASKNELMLQLADVYGKGNAFDSVGYYLEQVALNVNTPASWEKAGDAYFQAYNLALRPENVDKMAEKTQNCYNKVLAQEPNNLLVKTNLAMTYVASGSPMQAIATLRQVLDVNPDYEPALMNMGVLSLQSNQYDKAANRFRQVLKNNPANYSAQLGLAYSLIELKETDEAKAILKRLTAEPIDENLRREAEQALQNLN